MRCAREFSSLHGEREMGGGDGGTGAARRQLGEATVQWYLGQHVKTYQWRVRVGPVDILCELLLGRTS